MTTFNPNSTSKYSLVGLVATLALGAFILTGCRGWTSEQPPVHLNPNMDTQEKLKPYRVSEFFADGRAMQTPPEGTVARTMTGTEPRDIALLGTDEHLTAGKVGGAVSTGLPGNIDTSMAAMKRGQERYNIYCAPCHAKDGSGKGTVARRLTVKPPSFHDKRIHDLVPGDIFQTITHGKNYPNMPSYAAQVSPQDRWNIIYYMRALMRTQAPGLAAYPVGGGVAKRAFKPLADPNLAKFDADKSAHAIEVEEQIKSYLQGKVIEFASGSAKLSKKGRDIVDGLAPMLKKDPSVMVRVDGHTDNTGDSVANHKLADARAQSIMNELKAQGVKKDHLFSYGFGPDRPIADNATEEGRQKNRRIEFKVVDFGAGK